MTERRRLGAHLNFLLSPWTLEPYSGPTLVELQIENRRLKAREQELLEANNRYLQEARDARRELADLKQAV